MGGVLLGFNHKIKPTLLILFHKWFQKQGPTSGFLPCSAWGSQSHPKMRQFGIYIAQELFVDANIPTMRPGWRESEQGLNCPGALAEPGGSTWCCFSLPNSSNPACCLLGDVDLLSFSQKKKSGITPRDLILKVLLPPCSTTAATFKKLSFKNFKSAPKQDITIFNCQTRQARTQTMHFSSQNKNVPLNQPLEWQKLVWNNNFSHKRTHFPRSGITPSVGFQPPAHSRMLSWAELLHTWQTWFYRGEISSAVYSGVVWFQP